MIKMNIKSMLHTFCNWIFFILFSLIMQTSAYAEALSPYTTRELDELEKQFIQQINLSRSVERNPLSSQYLNEIGKKLAQAGQIKQPYYFIVKSRDINAFAGPGGYIGINTQLILTTTSESELAAVMAHELAHVRLHHLYGMIEHQKQMRIPMLASLLASIALGVLNPTVGMGAMVASMSKFSQDNINFTRLKEKEADRIGINMLMNAGYNPRSMAAFFKKMQENTRYYYTAHIPAILRTHPLDADRIAEAENRTARLGQMGINSSLEYSLFKEQIRTAISMESPQLFDFYDRQCTKQNTPVACQYGYALALINANKPQKAIDKLLPLLDQKHDNLNFQVAMAQAQTSLGHYDEALKRLDDLQKTFPKNYAALMAYAQGLIAANKPQKAASILLKGSRVYPQDLTLCQELARAQSNSNQKSHAYFTQAQCMLLEGQKRAAMARLKTALNLAKNDAYMKARITAKMDEIKMMSAD